MEDKDDYNSATITTDKDKFFYFKKTYYKGWQAFIDGKKVKTYYITPGFNAILVPEGEHKIEFKFKGHNNYLLGLFLSLLTLIILILYHIKHQRRKEDDKKRSFL